jgi:hypothetical protein
LFLFSVPARHNQVQSLTKSFIIKGSGAGEGGILSVEISETGHGITVTEADLLEAKRTAGRFTLEDTRRVSAQSLVPDSPWTLSTDMEYAIS